MPLCFSINLIIGTRAFPITCSNDNIGDLESKVNEDPDQTMTKTKNITKRYLNLFCYSLLR